jgi:SAM-dependent methyltransferase
VELFKRRNITAEELAPSPTSETVERLAGPGGSVLDIGAGAGRASLPLARNGHPVTAIEKAPEMAAALREESAGLDGYVVVEDEWPTAVDLGSFDVVMAAHVVYDVQLIEPFLRAMTAHARRGVVLELTEAHPWTPLGPYYRALHGIDRPDGPTVDDLADVIRDVIGTEPNIDRWERAGGTWFESWDEIVELYRRRLVVPLDRIDEVRPLIEPDVGIHDGRMVIGEPVRRLVTVWWPIGD